MGWSLDLEKYAEAKKESINVCRRKVAAKLYENVVKRTPVDTGRARGNWQITVGHDDTSEIDRLDKNVKGSPPQFIAEEEGKLIQVEGDESIFIHNNLPYIRRLEYGSSKQSPNGMVGVTLAEMDSTIKQAVKESGF